MKPKYNEPFIFLLVFPIANTFTDIILIICKLVL